MYLMRHNVLFLFLGVYKILGEQAQIIHLPLQPGQTIQAEPGAMVYTVNSNLSALIDLTLKFVIHVFIYFPYSRMESNKVSN